MLVLHVIKPEIRFEYIDCYGRLWLYVNTIYIHVYAIVEWLHGPKDML